MNRYKKINKKLNKKKRLRGTGNKMFSTVVSVIVRTGQASHKFYFKNTYLRWIYVLLLNNHL